MNDYPNSLSSYPKNIIDELLSLNDQQLFYYSSQKTPPLNLSLPTNQLMRQINELKKLPQFTQHNLPERPQDFLGLKPKKRHEVANIIHFLNHEKKISADDFTLVDIGGGVGNLSHMLNLAMGFSSLIIDSDAGHLNGAMKKAIKYKIHPPPVLLNTFFHAQIDIPKISNTKNHLYLGLHSCGDLSNQIIMKSSVDKTSHLFSFGCCYYKMCSKAKPFLPLLSRFFIEDLHHPLIHLYALSLATRAHLEISMEHYLLKKRVKFFRYGLHLFLMREFGISHFTEVGESPIAVYSGTFSHYVHSKLPQFNLKTKVDLEAFFNDKEIQLKLNEMWVASLFRYQFGRLLEIFILLDRAIYLEEANMEVTVGEFFNQEISPRNIGLWAIHK